MNRGLNGILARLKVKIRDIRVTFVSYRMPRSVFMHFFEDMMCLEPRDKTRDGIIIEFKIFDDKKERTLEQTAQRALKQIVEKQYEVDLNMRGIQHVRKYGIAFRGKQVLIVE